MKVSEFYTVLQGSRRLSFSEVEKPLCARDFWGKYRNTPKWNAEIYQVRLIPCRAEDSGLWFDSVICLIVLKEER